MHVPCQCRSPPLSRSSPQHLQNTHTHNTVKNMWLEVYLQGTGTELNCSKYLHIPSTVVPPISSETTKENNVPSTLRVQRAKGKERGWAGLTSGLVFLHDLSCLGVIVGCFVFGVEIEVELCRSLEGITRSCNNNNHHSPQPLLS